MPTETRLTPTPDAPVWTPEPAAEEESGVVEATGDSPAPDHGELPEIQPVQPLQPVEPAPAPARRRSKAVTYLLVIGGFVMTVGLAFAVGRTTAPGGSSGTGGFGGAGGNVPNGQFEPGEGFPDDFGGRDGGFGSPAIEGTVQSVEGGVITVKLADGSTVQVSTTSSTTYHTQQAAGAADVMAGKTVTIRVTGAPGSISRSASDVTIIGN